MKKCLIIIDYQNDFVSGSLAFKKAKKIEKRIVSKIKNYLKNKDDIIFTLDTHYKNYLQSQEGKNLEIIHCIDGSFGHKIYGKVAKYKQKAKKIFKKNSFGSLKLANFLKKQNYKDIQIVGLVTNVCVLSNAIIAQSALPEARITIDKKAVKSYDKKLHKISLKLLKSLNFNIA